MNKLLILLAILAMVIITLLLPTLSAADEPTATTAQLIAQLGSNSFAERTKAAEMLRARGPSVLPELRKVRNSPDAEVRRSVKELLAILEVEAALQPKRVTLKASQQPLSALLKEIGKQTGYKLALEDKNDDPLCDVDGRNLLFWEAVERVARATGHVLSANTSNETIQLRREKERSPFVVVSGPFRLEITRLHEDRDIDLTAAGDTEKDGRRDHRLTLTVAVVAEPRFILLATSRIQVETALDESKKPLGRPVVADKHESEWREKLHLFHPDFRQQSWAFLQRSSTRATKIGLLRGTLPIRVVVERKRVVLAEDIRTAQGRQIQLGRDKLQITRANLEKGGGFDLEIRVPPREPGVRSWWHERIRLEDAKGNRFEATGRGEMVSTNEHRISMNYPKPQGAKVGPPARLLIEDWVTLHHSIPFEFKDVPLP